MLRRTLALIALLGLALAPAAARAGQINVNPLRFTFGPGQSIGTLTLQNVGADPLRMQLHVFGWSQSANGAMQLAATRDIVAFPSLISLAPGEIRQIRVGYVGGKAVSEKTYRLFLEELPSLAGLQRGVGLAVRTRVGVPLFVEPENAKPKGRIAAVAVRRGHVEVGVVNDGSAFFMANRVAIRALDADGRPVLTREQPGWYVLAGDRRLYDFSIPGTVCGRIRGIALDVQTDAGLTLRETRAVSTACS